MKIRDHKAGIVYFKCDVCLKSLTECEIHYCDNCGKARKKAITTEDIFTKLDKLEESAWINLQQSRYSIFAHIVGKWRALNSLLSSKDKWHNPFSILSILGNDKIRKKIEEYCNSLIIEKNEEDIEKL